MTLKAPGYILETEMICTKLILVALLFRSMEAGGEPSKAQDCYSIESRLIYVASNKSKY